MSDPESRRAWEAVERRLRAVEEHLPDAPPARRTSVAVGRGTVRARPSSGAASAVPLVILAVLVVGVALIARGVDEPAGSPTLSPAATATVAPATPAATATPVAAATPAPAGPAVSPSVRLLEAKTWPARSARWHGYRVQMCVPRGRHSFTYVGADARLVLATGASITPKNGYGPAGVARGEEPPFWLTAQEQWVDKATLPPGKCVQGWLVFDTADRKPARLDWYGRQVPLAGTASAPGGATTRPRRTATVVRDGVRVTIRLDRERLRAGEPAWVTTEVRNVGDDDLVWSHDGCGTTVWVSGKVEGVRWRPGIEHQGKAGRFKKLALERLEVDDASFAVEFVPESFIAKVGQYGCADLRVDDRIKPGRAIRQRARWDGFAWLRLGPPPSGRVRLVGWSGYYWRAGAGEPERLTDQDIKVRLDVSLASSRDPNALDPPEVVDAALRSPAFRAWLESQDLGIGPPTVYTVLRFDPSLGLWKVGLFQHGLDQFHLALVSPVSGEVVAIVDEPWDRRDLDRDTYP